MILDERHIAYLNLVKAGEVRLWFAPGRKTSRYVHNVPEGKDRHLIDQIVAAQVKALGMTHVVGAGKDMSSKIELTIKGELVLFEEDEAWG